MCLFIFSKLDRVFVSDSGTMLGLCRTFVFVTSCLMTFSPQSDGGKILVFPVDGSHWINMKILLEELQARGHELTVVRASTSWYIQENSPLYTSITLETDQGLEDFFDVFLEEHLKVRVHTNTVLA